MPRERPKKGQKDQKKKKERKMGSGLFERGWDGRALGIPREPLRVEQPAEKAKGEQTKDHQTGWAPRSSGRSRSKEGSQVSTAESSRRGGQREHHSQLQDSDGRQNPNTGGSDRGPEGCWSQVLKEREEVPRVPKLEGSRIPQTGLWLKLEQR